MVQLKKGKHAKQQLEKFAMVLADIASMNKTVKAINFVSPPPPPIVEDDVSKSSIRCDGLTNKQGSAQWGKTGKWYPCSIIGEESNKGKLTVQWEDGTISTNLSKNKFRVKENRAPTENKCGLKRKLAEEECKVTPGCRGIGQFGKRGKWYPCAVLNVNNNSVLTVEWEDFTISNLPTTKFQLECMDVAELDNKTSSSTARPLKQRKMNLKKTVLENPLPSSNVSSSSPPLAKKNSVEYNMSKTPQFERNLVFLQKMRSCDSNNCFLWQKKESSSPIGDSVIWKPKNRDDWFDCSSEMAALCAEASLRSSLSPKTTVAFTTKKGGSSKKVKLIAPILIPKEYIEQRLDVDDPLNGFQLRHAQGGWLQGFALWTTFTSWTRYFKWDSLHPKSGMGSSSFRRSIEKQVVDEDGQLASELEQQSRAGDPHEGGVIWPTIAEISLVGGLGCGEFVLRMAMEKIRQEKRGYKYIVLQATESSKRFYERFGFKRVGAVCKYGKDSKNVCGYRHWADADEKNLEFHGGPSYMMAKRICDDHISPSFLGALEGSTVNRKPSILSHSKQDAFLEPSKIFSADEWIEQAERQTSS